VRLVPSQQKEATATTHQTTILVGNAPSNKEGLAEGLAKLTIATEQHTTLTLQKDKKSRHAHFP
jgi:hypothetical protein